MTATWITLAVVSILGITKLLTWWLGKPRKIESLKRRERELLEQIRDALAHGDTVRVSILERELRIVRKDLAGLNAK